MKPVRTATDMKAESEMIARTMAKFRGQGGDIYPIICTGKRLHPEMGLVNTFAYMYGVSGQRIPLLGIEAHGPENGGVPVTGSGKTLIGRVEGKKALTSADLYSMKFGKGAWYTYDPEVHMTAGEVLAAIDPSNAIAGPQEIRPKGGESAAVLEIVHRHNAAVHMAETRTTGDMFPVAVSSGCSMCEALGVPTLLYKARYIGVRTWHLQKFSKHPLLRADVSEYLEYCQLIEYMATIANSHRQLMRGRTGFAITFTEQDVKLVVRRFAQAMPSNPYPISLYTVGMFLAEFTSHAVKALSNLHAPVMDAVEIHEVASIAKEIFTSVQMMRPQDSYPVCDTVGEGEGE